MYNSGIGTPYWFEWEIGILECLNMLQDTSIESVILQSTDFQALDDVVVNYSDKSILNIQVKHTDEDANFTYSFLALDTDDVVILLEQSGVAENTVDMENLAKTVISVIGNNVLNIIFAILELKKMVLPLSFEAIEKELNSRFLNKQIDKYYEWIISSQEKSLLLYKIEAIMAFSSKRINAYDVAQMCGVEHDEAAFVLNGLYPIIVCEGDRYFAFHNDVKILFEC